MNIETYAQEHLEEAFRLYEADEFDKALEECDESIAIDPTLPDAHNLRGILLEELGSLLDALHEYQEAVRIDPEYEDANENLSSLKAELDAHRALVTVATFTNLTDAYIQKAKLEAEGIWTFLADANTVSADWLLSNAIGGAKLKVREEDVESAREILQHKTEPLEALDGDEEERCPRCGSNYTRYEKYAKRLMFLSWIFLSFPLPILKRRWTCQKCGHTWKNPK